MAKNRPAGYVDDIMKYSSEIITDDNNITFIYLSEASYEYLKHKYRSTYESPLSGVGSQLKNILSKMGIKASSTCPCNEYAKIMNNNGIEWCEQNIDTIIGWLRETAQKRHMPFIDYAAKIIVKRAIHNAKKFNQKG